MKKIVLSLILLTCLQIVAQEKTKSTLTDKLGNEYINASISEKLALNKQYASEVLPILTAYQTDVDDKFVGVKNFGKQISALNLNSDINTYELTSRNSNYWRATMEMSLGNQLIPTTKIFLLVSQGEIDLALKYIEILRLFSDPKTVANQYLKELDERIYLFNKDLNVVIQKGIVEHDAENYEAAISIYEDVLNQYPNSAWAKYELFYSKNALKLKNKEIDTQTREDWDLIQSDIYKSNPLYTMNVRASNGKEAYLLFKRTEINSLFQNKDNRIADFIQYANIAMDLEVYDFAAQLFWLMTSTKNEEKNLVYKYLYCLEKLGITDLKENFKGDFKKEFKKIENEKEKEMKNSIIYKAFQK